VVGACAEAALTRVERDSGARPAIATITVAAVSPAATTAACAHCLGLSVWSMAFPFGLS